MEPGERRRFLSKLGLAVAGIVALPLLARGLLTSSGKRPVPPDLPGEGSIFQPRDDDRPRKGGPGRRLV